MSNMRKPLTANLLILLITSTLANAGSISDPSVQDPLNTPDLRPLLTHLDSNFSVISQQVMASKGRCTISSVNIQGPDPITQIPQKVGMTRYLPTNDNSSESAKTELFIMPPTSDISKNPRGASTPLDQWYALELCNQGIKATILENWDGYVEPGLYDFGTHDRNTLRAMHAAVMALHYINSPVYIFGTSVGAIFSSILLGMVDQIHGGVLLVGGAPLVEVLKTTDQTIPRTMREERLAHYPQIHGLDDYEKLLTKNVRISPENFIVPEKAKNMIMIMANKDTTVPTPTQISLWNDWGKPTLIQHHGDHVHTIVKSFLLDRYRLKKFLIRSIRAD